MSYLPEWVRLVREPGAPALGAPVRQPREVAERLYPLAAREEQEVFWVLCLDVQHCVRTMTEITRGTLTSSLVHPREVFRIAIGTGAAGIILAHNHPSGDPAPSAEDRVVTRQLVEAGRLLDMPVLDHLVVGDDRYFSFAEAGLL